jgi:hypothetical protein
VIRLHLGLRGNYSFYHKQLDQDFHLIGGHHNILYSREFDMTVEPHTPELETFGIQFPRDTFLRFTSSSNDLLKRFADDIADGKNTILSDQWGAIDPAIHQVIRQIIENPYKGDLQQLFLLSKSIELLVLCAESCDQAARHKPEFIKTPGDKEKLNAVRELINEKLDSPPNLSEIARTVGLNEYAASKSFSGLPSSAISRNNVCSWPNNIFGIPRRPPPRSPQNSAIPRPSISTTPLKNASAALRKPFETDLVRFETLRKTIERIRKMQSARR